MHMMPGAHRPSRPNGPAGGLAPIPVEPP